MSNPTGKYGSLIRKARQLDEPASQPKSQPEPQAEAINPQQSSLPLRAIQDRTTSTRQLRPEHVEALAESIAVIGLIEPLVVDMKGQLLAGGHRLAAIRHLKDANPNAYGQHFEGDRIPVRVLPFDAAAEPDRALQIEVAENEQRRDYTAAEVKALAERLKAAGYIDRKGRPSKGEKPLLPALEVIVGKSMSTLKRYLQEEPASAKPENSSNELFNRKRHLKRAHQALEKWQQEIEAADLTSDLASDLTPGLTPGLTPDEEKLLKQLPRLLKLLQSVAE